MSATLKFIRGSDSENHQRIHELDIMKTIIAGSRTITSKFVIGEAVLESKFDITEVVSGAARGVDEIGEQWAEEHGVPIKRFPAEWEFYGKRAGPVRNVEMAKYAEALVAVWDGKSKGTQHMIREAQKRGLKWFIKLA